MDTRTQVNFFHCFPGPPCKIDISIHVLSVVPITEIDMVRTSCDMRNSKSRSYSTHSRSQISFFRHACLRSCVMKKQKVLGPRIKFLAPQFSNSSSHNPSMHSIPHFTPNPENFSLSTPKREKSNPLFRQKHILFQATLKWSKSTVIVF